MKKLRKLGFQAIAQNNEKIIQKSSLAHTRSLKIINGTQNKVEKYQKYMENNQITGDPVLYRRRAFGPPPPKGDDLQFDYFSYFVYTVRPYSG